MNYQKLLDQLERHEGCKLKPYRCTEGYWTIGIGRNLETNSLSDDEQNALFGMHTLSVDQIIKVLSKSGISDTEAKILFENDVVIVESDLCDRIELDGHKESRQAILINMAFQMGVAGLMKFRKTIDHFNNRRYKKCSVEMLNSRWAKQTPNRAEELAMQMSTGNWQ